MPLAYTAAVLHSPQAALVLETVSSGPLAGGDVRVRVRAAGLCHTDLEVIDGSLPFPMPIVLGHEAAGVVEDVGPGVRDLARGDPVVLSWNPSCGHCFYCDRNSPILCEEYLEQGPKAVHIDGRARAQLGDGRDLHHLMFTGAFAEYCVVPAQQAIRIPDEMPLDRACLIGCAVMTGVGAALNIARIHYSDTVMIIGCGAVGLAAVQGARLAGARSIVAVDLNPAKLELARRVGATHTVDAGQDDPIAFGKSLTAGRGVDVVIEAAGSAAGFRTSVEAVRPGGEVIWLGKQDSRSEVAFRWGSLMQEKRLRRVSYGGARPARDFPLLAGLYLDGQLKLDDLISRRIRLSDINDGFAALRNGQAIRSVVVFD